MINAHLALFPCKIEHIPLKNSVKVELNEAIIIVPNLYTPLLFYEASSILQYTSPARASMFSSGRYLLHKLIQL